MNNNPISNFEDLIKNEYSNIAGIAIVKDESLIYEKYFDGYTKDDVLHIASVTKSIISILIGIALDKGYVKNIEQKILEFFPDYTIKRGEKTIQKVTLKNLLTMTAPFKYKSEPYTKVYSSDDWVKAALDLLGGKVTSGSLNILPLA
ncbi:serine hydrolase [Niallia circulans]|uniref:serine hydrolase n=1 Tax=Niallia circulans TaxID=1397 RepID=UPI002040AFC2|nr:serine hydrolase [Niallia circulans]